VDGCSACAMVELPPLEQDWIRERSGMFFDDWGFDESVPTVLAAILAATVAAQHAQSEPH
jgi:hypothetical protein